MYNWGKKYFYFLFICMFLLTCCTNKINKDNCSSILFIGDSIIAGLEPVIESQLNNKKIKYIQEGNVSSGLCNKEFYN